MKRIPVKTWLFLPVLLLMIYSCKDVKKLFHKEPRPEDTLRQFLTYLNEGKYDSARAISTAEAALYVDMIESFSGMGGEPEKREIKEINCEVEGEFADCVYCCNLDGESENIKLVKVDGNWKIDISKDEPVEGLLEEVEDEIDSLTQEINDTAW